MQLNHFHPELKTTVIKYISFFIINLVAADIFGQQEMKKVESFKFDAQPDSIISKQQHGYIYITRDTSAEMFDWLAADMNVNGSEMNIFREYASHIKKKFGQVAVVKNLGVFPRKWNSVYLYKDSYYVYSPSDWMSNTGYYVSDSVIFVIKSDPDDLFVILNHKKINKNLDEFRIVNYAGEKHNVQIRLVDAAYGIYIWTFVKNGDLLKYLMQDSRFVKRLPMIVADCDEKCVLEFEFDKPDFENILRKSINPRE